MAMDSAPIDLGRLVGDHHASVYRYAYRLTGSVADAEDLTQQVFLAAHGTMHQVRNIESVRSWLFTILRNCFIKSRKKVQPIAAGSIELDVDSIPARTPAGDEIDCERIQQALDQLPESYRVVLALFYYEDCSYKEIAEKLELPIGTVMSRLARAKSHLRAHLFDETVCSAPGIASEQSGAHPRG